MTIRAGSGGFVLAPACRTGFLRAMRSKHPADTVLFDLDGTLVDNFTAIHRCYAEVACELGFRECTYDEVLHAVGGSIKVTMRRLLPPESADRAVELFLEKFPSMMFDGLRVYPGVAESLDALAGSGLKLAVFTNKEVVAARRIVEHAGIATRFAAVFGTGDTPWRKPEPEFTRHALSHLGASPARTVLIGDSPFDIAAGRNAGLLAVHCVTTGSHTAEQLFPDSPDSVHADMRTLTREVFGV